MNPKEVRVLQAIGIAQKDKKRLGTFLKHGLLHLFIGIGAMTMLLPFLWMVSSSLKTGADIFVFPPQWIPRPPVWSNYPETIAAMPFVNFVANSIKIASLATLGQLITCSMAAYAFARMEFPGRDLLFGILMAALMIPGQVTMIPIFLIMRSLGWVDTHLPLIIPYFCGGAFDTFLMRQFFLTLPKELEDAAMIDGCSRFAILWKIFVPLSKPALATLGVFTFMNHWNDLLGPVIYLTSFDKMTLPVGLAVFREQYNTQWNLLMAGALISVAPILVMYVCAQKYFIQGITMTGIKG